MSASVIVVDRIGKLYRIGLAAPQHRTFREMLVDATKAPLRRLRSLRDEAGGEDAFWALRDVSFEVGQGEVVGIIGHNGAGKSTLLKILSRITEPTEGEAHIRGRVGSLLEVGTGFHPELTGRENIFLNGAILGMKRREIRANFDAIVEFSGVEKFLDTPVKRYSSGMAVRLAFAVAANLDPEVLLIDEVLAVGDVSFQKKCLGKMTEVAEGGRTVLFVSHNMNAVSALCDRVIAIQQGRIVREGEPEEVIRHYLEGRDVGANLGLADQRLPDMPEKDAQITRVQLLGPDGEPSLKTELKEPLTLRMEFVLRREFPNLLAVCQVRSAFSEILFESTEIDWLNACNEEQQVESPKQPGRYKAQVELPAPLLNVGHYGLFVCLQIPLVERVHELEPIPFEVTEMNGFSSSLFMKPRHGSLAIPLKWKVSRLEAPEGWER